MSVGVRVRPGGADEVCDRVRVWVEAVAVGRAVGVSVTWSGVCVALWVAVSGPVPVGVGGEAVPGGERVGVGPPVAVAVYRPLTVGPGIADAVSVSVAVSRPCHETVRVGSSDRLPESARVSVRRRSELLGVGVTVSVAIRRVAEGVDDQLRVESRPSVPVLVTEPLRENVCVGMNV